MRQTYDNLPNVAPKDVGGSVLMHTLHKALSVSRPDGSVEEAKFVAWMATTFHATLIDGAGNIHFDRRTNGEGRCSQPTQTPWLTVVGTTSSSMTDASGELVVTCWELTMGQALR